MYVIAVFLKRYSLMAMGFAVNPLGQYSAPYFPSLVEVLIALGILALGTLMVTAAVKVLPLEVPEDEHGHGHGGEPAKETATERADVAPALEAG